MCKILPKDLNYKSRYHPTEATINTKHLMLDQSWNVYSFIHTLLSSMLIVISVHTATAKVNIELYFQMDCVHRLCTWEWEIERELASESALPHGHMYWISFVSIVCLIYIRVCVCACIGIVHKIDFVLCLWFHMYIFSFRSVCTCFCIGFTLHITQFMVYIL